MSNKNASKKSETALREEQVLSYWSEEGTFEKTLQKEAPHGEFVFYDGPPFATGLPHIGHLLISSYKDAVGRYKTMRGYHVPRRWGWDCHGLPIENIVENKLGLKTKKDIEAMGIDRFNEEARNSVLTYVSDWKHYIARIGRWVDFDNSYKTMDNAYIESVWWALKKIHSDGRLYEGRKVLMYCPHCETPLSKAEIAMDNSYKDVSDTAVYVQFKLQTGQKVGTFTADDNTYILAWTTTPWTLPANVALAVREDIRYVLVAYEGRNLVLGKERLEVLHGENKVLAELTGADLVGLSYEPLYEVAKAKAAGKKMTWTVQPADFVTTEDGTGVVHIAPMYGEDDYNLGLANDLPVVPLLDTTGTYNADAPELVRGMFYKKGGKYVLEDLEKRGLVVQTHQHTHSYPHCYRCGTALIYNALTSWFIDIQSVKERMLEANEDITWYPDHLKHGRFKHNVETAPDWTISRNRFWASPLPIWKNEKTDALRVFGSLEELRTRTKRSGNTYYLMRHGEAQSNVAQFVSSTDKKPNPITDVGKEQVRASIPQLKKAGVTKIIASPCTRTRETAALVAEGLGISKEDVVIDERLREWQLDELDGKPVQELRKRCPTYEERFVGCGTGESLLEMKTRVAEALYSMEEKYADEIILIVGHEYTAWFLDCAAVGADVSRAVALRGETPDYIQNAEVRSLDFVPLPHNARYELDLHRPYIDTLQLIDEDGASIVRVPEVVDCWVESGAMPFAAEHYPYENEEVVKRRYPGDCIAEYIAQTRTWFYYMHALGVLLFDAPSFKNCVTTGTVLAADGSKMSKSKGNYTDPLEHIDRYGADALRYYMLGSTLMAAEDVAFKDEDLREAHNRFINMLWNSYRFYEMHASGNAADDKDTTPTVLDRWIMARLCETTVLVTEAMDHYDTIRSARALREFVTDLSTWYIRRSRDRFKSHNAAERQLVLACSREIFLTLAKLIAPITPFIAESVYQGVGGERDSVHLEAWPELAEEADPQIIEDMAEVRRVASLALEARQRAGIKVRQPLAQVTLKGTTLQGKDELLAILCDEVNVKEVRFGSGFDGALMLDTTLTPELVREGHVRDLVRAVQDMRKKAGLLPDDHIVLIADTDVPGKEVVERAHAELTSVAGVEKCRYAHVNDGTELAVGEGTVRLVLERV